MNYLKYFLISWVSLILIIKVGDFLGIGAMGLAVGIVMLWKSRIHKLSYFLWILSSYLWYSYCKSALTEFPAQSDPTQYHIGLFVILSAIILHPICYGISKFVIFLWNKSRPTENAI